VKVKTWCNLEVGGIVMMHEEVVLFKGLIKKRVHTQTGFERNWTVPTGKYKNNTGEKSVFTFL
jgi:hypothetical protein